MAAKPQSSHSLMVLRRGTAAQLRLSRCCCVLPTWTLAPDISSGGCSGAPSPVSSCPPRLIGVSCHRRMPGRARDLSGARGTGRCGQRCHLWTRDGADPPLSRQKLGWDGLEETSPQNWCLGAPPLLPSTSSSHLQSLASIKWGPGAAAGARGTPSSPENCSALAGVGM